MVKNLIYSFLLDGAEVQPFALRGTQIHLTRNSNNLDTAEIHLSTDVEGTKVPLEGQSIIISRGEVTATEQYRFRGNVKMLQKKANKYVLTCKNEINKLKYDLFTKSYDRNIDPEQGELSAIFSDIGTNGGFVVDTEDSGTALGDLTVDKYISKRDSRLNRMNVIANILNWFFRQDYDTEKIRFEPKGYTTYPNTLTVGTNVYNIPKWKTNLEVMRNKITVEGAFEVDTRIESETGDNSTVTFFLKNVPETTDLTVDGVLKVQGVLGGSTDFDYTIDKELKSYTFLVAPTGGQAIVMTYSTKIPRPVTGKDKPSIERTKLTQHESFTFKDVVTVDDAETRLSQLLELLKDGEVETELLTDEYDIQPGNVVPVVDSLNSIKNGNYVVFDIFINYPEVLDTIQVGSEKLKIEEIFQTIQERLKILEKDESAETEILRHVIKLAKDITFGNEDFKIETITKICDSFIMGHPTNGIIGIGDILDNFASGNSGNWSGSDFVISDEASIKLVGANSMKAVWSGGAATGLLTSTQSFQDINTYTGAASGTPTKGTVGLWVYVSSATDITDIKLRLGSGSSDYTEMSAKAYASISGYENFSNLTFSMQVGWNYLLFDLDGGTETGTPDWTSVDYARLEIDLSANATFYVEYLTVSSSDLIGLNGFGKRTMVVS